MSGMPDSSRASASPRATPRRRPARSGRRTGTTRAPDGAASSRAEPLLVEHDDAAREVSRRAGLAHGVGMRPQVVEELEPQPFLLASGASPPRAGRRRRRAGAATRPRHRPGRQGGAGRARSCHRVGAASPSLPDCSSSPSERSSWTAEPGAVPRSRSASSRMLCSTESRSSPSPAPTPRGPPHRQQTFSGGALDGADEVVEVGRGGARSGWAHRPSRRWLRRRSPARPRGSPHRGADRAQLEPDESGEGLLRRAADPPSADRLGQRRRLRRWWAVVRSVTWSTQPSARARRVSSRSRAAAGPPSGVAGRGCPAEHAAEPRGRTGRWSTARTRWPRCRW